MAKMPTPLVIGSGVIAMIALLGYGCATSGNQSTPTSTNMGDGHNAKSGTLVTDNGSNYSVIKQGATTGSLPATTVNNNPALNQSSANNLSPDSRMVRPDIQHILQAKYQDAAELNTAMQGAAILQSYLEQPSQDAVALLKRYDCIVISLTQADQNFIKSLTFDTPDKKALIKNGLKNYVPPVSVEIVIDGNGNAVSPCAGQ